MMASRLSEPGILPSLGMAESGLATIRVDRRQGGNHWLRACTALTVTCFLVAHAGATDLSETLEQARTLRAEHPEAALKFLDAALDDSATPDDPNRLFELLHLRADTARDLGRHHQALGDVERLDALAERAGAPVLAGRALRLRGTIYAERGDIPAALEVFHEARNVLAGTDALPRLGAVTLAIGIAHVLAQDFERGRGYYEEALEIARAAEDTNLESRVLSNLAFLISELEGAEAGLAYHREVLALAEERGDHLVAAYQQGQICQRLVVVEHLEEAGPACQRAIEQLETIGHVRALAGAQTSRARLSERQGRLREAVTRYQEALRTSEEISPAAALEALEKIADLYERLGEPTRALEHYRRMVALREQTLDEERRAIVEELEVQYEVKRREREIETLQLRNQLQGLQLQRRNWMVFGLGAAFVLSSSLALVIWRSYRRESQLERQLAERNQELEEALDTIGQIASEDPLTGLLNRRGFLDLARHEMARAERYGQQLAMVMADIDHFKTINDDHGHAVGDEILQAVAKRMREGLRGLDVVARWGGEEFLCLLTDTDAAAARRAIERIRELIAEMPIATTVGKFSVSLTYGIAFVDDSLGAAIEAADAAMYEGKRAGRNRVVTGDV